MALAAADENRRNGKVTKFYTAFLWPENRTAFGNGENSSSETTNSSRIGFRGRETFDDFDRLSKKKKKKHIAHGATNDGPQLLSCGFCSRSRNDVHLVIIIIIIITIIAAVVRTRIRRIAGFADLRMRLIVYKS